MYWTKRLNEVKKSVLYEASSKPIRLNIVLIAISTTIIPKGLCSGSNFVRCPFLLNQNNKIGNEILTENQGNNGKKNISKRIRLKHFESN